MNRYFEVDRYGVLKTTVYSIISIIWYSRLLHTVTGKSCYYSGCTDVPSSNTMLLISYENFKSEKSVL